MSQRALKALYDRGVNISAHLRGNGHSTPEAIEISYDLQAGSYIAELADPAFAQFNVDRARAIARIIRGLCTPASILEAGVGDGTTLAAVVNSMDDDYLRVYGFDLSWSRAAYAKNWLRLVETEHPTICTGDLRHIPFADDSIDVVYTAHSIEPNRGSEVTILRELYRVTRQYLLLLEPAYELCSTEARARMDRHGYCRGIAETARSLGYSVLEHRLFEHSRPLINPTALTLIRKDSRAPLPAHALACPRFKTPLKDIAGALYSSEALAVYPVIGGIPCLRIEKAILASKYAEIMGAIK